MGGVIICYTVKLFLSIVFGIGFGNEIGAAFVVFCFIASEFIPIFVWVSLKNPEDCFNCFNNLSK
jgi:hypothetical protein